MSLVWVVVGTFFQLMLAFMLFMLAAFAGGGLANGRNLSKLQIRLLDSCLFVLPGSAILSAILVIIVYDPNASASNFYWYLFPVIVSALYFYMLSRIEKKS